MSNKKTGVTGGGDAVSSKDDDDVDLPREQHWQAGVKGAGKVLAEDFLLRWARFGSFVWERLAMVLWYGFMEHI